jgi:Tol biopolymer transport system component
MDPEQWDKVVDLFHAARERTGEERLALLDSLCSGNYSLRIVVEQMLRDDDVSCSFLNRPATDALAAVVSSRRVPAAPAARFGRYEIVSSIGRGGMGEVWAARDTELGRLVALKFLSPQTVFGQDEDLTQEARAASALNHPNIVTVHEVIRHEDNAIIVMELVEGDALRTLCGTPQPADRVIQLGDQIARALAAAHNTGLIHRDIKPENILLRKDGYVKVVDFGLAGRITGGPAATNSGFLAGTPRYMSPEQARGESISPASDIFSFGLVLYELATGQHAFPSDSPFEALRAILTTEPSAASSINPSVPLRLDLLIRAMLAKDPTARPSVDNVKRTLGELLQADRLTAAAKSRARPRWLALAATLIALAAIGWFVFGRSNPAEFSNLRIQPLTSQAGWEGSPAFSPDGQSIAFTWTERLDTPWQIYIKRINASDPVKLTDFRSDGIIGSVVWSPDSSRIAFKRAYRESGAIFAIGRSGGEEKKLLDLENGDSTSAIDWSPDGALLAFSERTPGGKEIAIYLFNLRTGEKRKLTSPPPEATGDWDPKFSPDGRLVAFKRVTAFWADDLYIAPLAGGAPRQVTAERRGIWGHAWTADGRSLIVSCQREGSIFGLWRFPLTPPGQPERIVQGGTDAITPATCRTTSRVGWVNQLQDLNIYRISAARAEAPVKLIASTVRDQDPSYSAGGRIAFVSDRSGSREIWMANADGSSQVRITNFNGPDLRALQWSPNGRRLAFGARLQGQSNIFSLDCESATLRCGNPKRVTSGGVAEVPSWSADGDVLYFASDRTGRWEVWKQPAFGSVATQMTRNGGYACRESPDGKWLYFSKVRSGNIWRIPAAKSGGETPSGEELVIGPPNNAQPRGWTLTLDEIFFIDRATTQRPAAIRGYRISTKETRLILPLRELLPDSGDIGVSASPDAQWLLYSQLDRSGSNVIVADNAR